METIDDVVKEIRAFSDHSSWVSPGTLREFADRIDSAYKRVIVENHRVQDAFNAKVAECDALHAENDRVVIVIKVFFFLLIVVLYLHVICKMIWG